MPEQSCPMYFVRSNAPCGLFCQETGVLPGNVNGRPLGARAASRCCMYIKLVSMRKAYRLAEFVQMDRKRLFSGSLLLGQSGLSGAPVRHLLRNGGVRETKTFKKYRMERGSEVTKNRAEGSPCLLEGHRKKGINHKKFNPIAETGVEDSMQKYNAPEPYSSCR